MSLTPEPVPLTEAAGLLASGAIFPRRVGLRSLHYPRPTPPAEPQAEFLAGFKRGAFALYFGDEPIIHFDPLGRWQRMFVAGIHYLKGLDTQVRAVDRVRVEDRLVLRRRTLGASEVDHLDARIAAWAQNLVNLLREGAFEFLAPPPPAQPITPDDLIATLDQIAAWDADAWSGHLARYRHAFGADPLPLLPPDCPNPLILRPDGRLAPIHLVDHARAVIKLLGDRLNQCRDIYLAGTGWVDRPSHEVLDLLGAITNQFPVTPNQPRPRATDSPVDAPRFETIHGAIDDPAQTLVRDHPWPALRSAQLGRIAVQVRSDPTLIRALPELVAAIKAAKIGVTLMLHLNNQVAPGLCRLVAALPLARGDFINVIATPTNEDETPPAPLDLNEWKDRLTAQFPTPGPRVVVYNPDKQWF